jgi:UDP-N-acetylglucosamine transferase subunit ALG13
VIFVTVGAQMPFDRLIEAVDQWALMRNRPDVFAQIGPSNLKPKMISVARFIEPQEFRMRVNQADLIVAHAGMGSIITALECGKPIIVMPRRGDLRETRNDHQLATAKYFEQSRQVIVAHDEKQLIERLDNTDGQNCFERIGSHASEMLITTIRSFLAGTSQGPDKDRR